MRRLNKVESQAAAQCLVLAHNRIGSIFRGCITHAVCAGRAIASPSIIVTMRLIVRPLRLFHEEADLPANASPRRMPPTRRFDCCRASGRSKPVAAPPILDFRGHSSNRRPCRCHAESRTPGEDYSRAEGTLATVPRSRASQAPKEYSRWSGSS